MDKRKILESVVSQVEKRYGKGIVMSLKEREVQKVEVIPSGSLSLDIATGIGGIPRGKVIEIFGQESSGKTTLALQIIAQAQRMGGIALFIDAEHALDPKYAKALGVDVDNLYISQPDYGEQALEIAETLISSGAVDVVVVDSVAALVPREELEGEMGETIVGKQARLMSQALRKLKSVVNKSKAVLIFINQIREKIGTFFGNPETTPGGRALKFFADMRIEVKRGQEVKEGNNRVGYKAKLKVVKNKLAPPFKEAEVEIHYGKGICNICEVIDLGVEYGLIKKSGSWFSYKDIRLGQGREQSIKFLRENGKLLKEIEEKIREVAGLVSRDIKEGSKSKGK